MENEIAIGIPANIQKNENEIIIHLSLAGYDKSEVSIKLENQDLIISTHIQEKMNTYLKQEFKKMNLKRVFRLPDSVVKDSIEAKFDNGVLKIILKKVSQEKTSINII
ncbi:MAG: Hsp20/alpha crystallin family protein [Saprospiraceae bacterium]